MEYSYKTGILEDFEMLIFYINFASFPYHYEIPRQIRYQQKPVKKLLKSENESRFNFFQIFEKSF